MTHFTPDLDTAYLLVTPEGKVEVANTSLRYFKVAVSNRVTRGANFSEHVAHVVNLTDDTKRELTDVMNTVKQREG